MIHEITIFLTFEANSFEDDAEYLVHDTVQIGYTTYLSSI